MYKEFVTVLGQGHWLYRFWRECMSIAL